MGLAWFRAYCESHRAETGQMRAVDCFSPIRGSAALTGFSLAERQLTLKGRRRAEEVLNRWNRWVGRESLPTFGRSRLGTIISIFSMIEVSPKRLWPPGRGELPARKLSN